MMTTMMRKKACENILSWCNHREYENGANKRFERHLQVSLPLANRLSLQQELEGHTGCVNCLDWNESGELLASGSDDFNVIIWDIRRGKSKVKIPSGHEGNIFSVKFLPSCNSNLVASAAADATVRVHCATTLECTRSFMCHTRRVKRLSVNKQSPYLLWSGSEDGTVREFDLREPHSCSSINPCRNVIINLTENIGPSIEVKCVEVHPLYPELIAVGGNDPYVRLYDRRMIKLHGANMSKTKESNLPAGCVRYFAPGHLPLRVGRTKPAKHRNYVTTHVSFSPDGNELLQNLGGEHIYLYDINKKQNPLVFTASHNSHNCNISSKQNGLCNNANPMKNGVSRNGFVNGLTSTYATRKGKENDGDKIVEKGKLSNELPDKALQLKLKGNDAFSDQKYFQAVICYNNALKYVPDSSILYANRAAALLKRSWDGDLYAALRDCQRAVELDSTHSKASYRQARCLYELKWYEEAHICLQVFKETFPRQADGYSIAKLEMEVAEKLKHAADGNDDDSASNGKSETCRHPRGSPHATKNDEERSLQENACDFEARFIGACNTTTDIKETNYFGRGGNFIVAGSDCGCMFLWERSTTNLIKAFQGDASIVNCLQPHPSTCLLATSGIDPVVRLWSPCLTENRNTEFLGTELEGLVVTNQKRMNTDPLEEMLRTMGYRSTMVDSASDDEEENPAAVQCRFS